MATSEKTQRVFVVEDRGYDCDQQGGLVEVTAPNFLDAVRQLPGLKTAALCQPINDVRGCSTYAVYEKIRRANSGDWSKIGTVYLHSERDAE